MGRSVVMMVVGPVVLVVVPVGAHLAVVAALRPVAALWVQLLGQLQLRVHYLAQLVVVPAVVVGPRGSLSQLPPAKGSIVCRLVGADNQDDRCDLGDHNAAA